MTENTPLSSGLYTTNVEHLKVSIDLSREELFELGRKVSIDKFVDFPVEITEEIKKLN